MNRLSRIGIGGVAKLYTEAENEKEVIDAVRQANDRGLKIIPVGECTNVAFADGLVDCLVIKIKRKSDAVIEGPSIDSGQFTLDAMVPVKKIVKYLAQNGYDATPLAGIPGTLGGAIVNNAGTSRGSIENFIKRVKVIDDKGNIYWIDASDLAYRTRSSNLKTQSRTIVLAGEFIFTDGDPIECTRRITEIDQHRKEQQPHGLTLGSTFANPPQSQAWHLIKESGLDSHTVGPLKLSERHANWIINTKRGAATAEHLKRMICELREGVEKKTGIVLEPEIQILGESSYNSSP